MVKNLFSRTIKTRFSRLKIYPYKEKEVDLIEIKIKNKFFLKPSQSVEYLKLSIHLNQSRNFLNL